MRDRGRVGDDHPAADGVVQRAAQHLVDLEHGLGVEATEADVVALDGKVRVHALHVVWSQVTQRHPADARNDVQPDVGVITGPRRGPQPGLVGGQPPLGQVDAHGEAGAAR